MLTLGALLLYMRSTLRLEYSSVAILFLLVLAFEVLPYRGAPVITDAVEDVAREVAPSVTDEVAPDGEVSIAESEETREVLLRGAEFFRGFGNEALITISLLLMLAKGVERSGALRPLGRLLARIWLINRHAALLLTILASVLLSAFVNNTPVVVMMISLVVGVSTTTGIATTKALMPAGFAAILGGMCTTIGSSTNLLVTSISERLGGPVFTLLDFALPGSIAAAIGVLYLWVVAPRLLPDRASTVAGAGNREFRSIVRAGDVTGIADRTLAEVLRDVDDGIRIERVRRGEKLDLARLPSLVIQDDDRLHLRGPADKLKQFLSAPGSTHDEADRSRYPDQQLAEIVVTQSSPLQGQKMSALGPSTGGVLSPIGIHRTREWTKDEADEDPTLDTGDLLLVQGMRADIDSLRNDSRFLVLGQTIPVARTAKAPLAVSILLAVVLAAAFGITSIMVSAMCGAGLMLMSRCLTWDEAWRAVDTRLVLVIVTSLALGTALSATGATDFLARGFVALVGGLSPGIIVFGLLVVTALLTEVVTNNAIAVIATPIALGVANGLDLPPTAFVLAVLFGSNMSFLTPIGYQTNLLVLAAGDYRFSDFARAGLPLQILLWIILGILLPVLYF